MDNENINIHESKNQLATLREMVKKNKKALQYIDNIIKQRIDESPNIEKLKYIPKGGLKGLLYYKISIAEKNGVQIFIDTSKKSYSFLSKLTLDENKVLCRLVGIFLDNAIEAAKISNKKLLSIEIYHSDSDLTIAISNSFNGKINFDKMKEFGYSTKGENRGKGLYLANKFSKKYKIFSLENRIINEFYVQKILINKK